MAQPMPPPPPPKKGMSLLPLILVLVIAILGVGWYQGWFAREVGPDGKGKFVINKEKFNADKDALLKSTGELYTKTKDKLTGMMTKAKDAKPEDKAGIDKEIDALKKKLADLEEAKKKAEAATDDEVLKGLNDSVKKLLEKDKDK